MTRGLVVGNWKMNLDHVEAVHLTQQLVSVLASRPAQHVDVTVAPPFVDLRSVVSVVEAERSPITVAAQHVNDHESGAFTGEVSVTMLRRLGVATVLVGHSERRSLFHMDDQLVASTLRAVRRGGLEAIVCVGESLATREARDERAFVRAQIAAALGGLEGHDGVTVAYEPVWAIGTGQSATTDQVAEMVEEIREEAARCGYGSARVLYGGSVTGDNAAQIATEGRVDGFLVGGASLKAESFAAIVSACNDCYAERR